MLDPVWAPAKTSGLPISQHGGTGAPGYSPPGFASILTLAMEHSFFSSRSLSQLIVGGVFDRFPDLQLVFVETEAYWMPQVINRLSQFIGMGNDWIETAGSLYFHRTFVSDNNAVQISSRGDRLYMKGAGTVTLRSPIPAGRQRLTGRAWLEATSWRGGRLNIRAGARTTRVGRRG